jgi:hypothetical protein
MRIVVLDLETHFNRTSGYTLDKMSTESYIRDSRFEADGAAIKWQADIPARWYDERQLRHVLKSEDWSDTLLVAHHCQFDGLILSHHYAVHPRGWGCTLSMARLLLGNHLPVSLDAVRKAYGLSSKSTPYGLMDGKHWADMSPATQQQVAEGSCDEVESIWWLFHKFIEQGFPLEELKVIDLTVRMFVSPRLVGDVDLLATLWEKEDRDKAARLLELQLSATDLASSDRFASLLRSAGCEPMMKPGKNGEIYAFAKTDQFMRDLLEDDDPRVRALAEARIGQKSTLLQTRSATLGWAARRGPLPVYLRYCGAHTTRWSGGDGVNWQNFKRNSDLRKAIMAPDGYLLGVIDLSQIECRLLNYLAGQTDVIEAFKKGEDIYVKTASEFYGRPITKADPAERGTGKQLELSCGYGCGATRFQATARLGLYGPPVAISAELASRAVAFYRAKHGAVVAYWRQAESILASLAANQPVTWGPCRTENHTFYLPNQAPLIYDTLEWHIPDSDAGTDLDWSGAPMKPYWRLLTRSGWTKMYGAKFVENVVQALARVVLSQAMIAIDDELGLPIATCSHDEVVVVVADNSWAEEQVKSCAAIMKRSPVWLPGIPLDAEYTIGRRYSK